ncbi:MAG TPA: hypothetical protein DD827_10310 [Gammaproteobacteria bacterium]|nr:hypothetical protein [Gammaproteobacteria bacterium]
MLYLLTHIFLYIIGATLIGWLIAYSIGKQKENRLIEDHQNLQSKHSLLEDYRDRINKDFYALKEQDRAKTEEITELKKHQDSQDHRQSHFISSHYSNTKELEKSIDHYQLEAASANLKVSELMERLSKIVDEKNVLKDEIRDLNSGVQFERDTEFHSLNSDRKKLSAQVNLLQNERGDYEERVKNLIDEQSSLSAKVKELKKHETDPEQIEELTTQIINIRNERDDYFDRLRTISNVLESSA